MVIPPNPKPVTHPMARQKEVRATAEQWTDRLL